MTKLRPIAGSVSCLLLFSAPAFAWGPEGHALVGKIADQLLAGTNAGAKVDAILGTYTLEDAAKWPDCVRSVHKEDSGDFKFVPDKYTAPCTAFETADETARMEDYAKRNWDTFPYRPGHGDHEAYHFADIPIQDGAYAPTDIGASDHDVVHAINAAIAELTHQPVPVPFSIKDDKEAILMLAHFVGDLHQPLHVGADYLDASGNPVNPSTPSEADADNTAGGNLIAVGRGELHHEWDTIPRELETADIGALVREAKTVAIPPDVPVGQWAAAWASEGVIAAGHAYNDHISFAGTGEHKWRAQFDDRTAYLAAEHSEQQTRVIQGGARLAALLQAIWP